MIQSGTILNRRYEVLGELGRGGMGIVYRGRNVALDRPVAIKIFNEDLDPDMTKRAQREAHALANVTHPNLVRVFSLEKDESGRLILIFDFIDGQSLSATLRERKLTVEEIESLFKQICDGLDALHQNGFVHRDLKPSNLMVDSELRLTIIDFGLAKPLERSQKLTATGTMLGTPAYMSPEQFAAAPTSVQSDLYSAACVLFEMLTGHPPFMYESPYLMAHAQLTEMPATIYEPLDKFFLVALAKEPEKRFSSAKEMFDSFKKAIVGFDGTQAVRNKPRLKRVKNRRDFAAQALIGVIAAGVLCFTLTFNNKQKNLSQVNEIAGNILTDSMKFPPCEDESDWEIIANSKASG